MKKGNETYTKFKKTNRKYGLNKIFKGIGLGTALCGYIASQNGFFNDIAAHGSDYAIDRAILNAGNYYNEFLRIANPNNNVPSYVFLGLAGGFIAWLAVGAISKKSFRTNTIKNLYKNNSILNNKIDNLNNQIRVFQEEANASNQNGNQPATPEASQQPVL